LARCTLLRKTYGYGDILESKKADGASSRARRTAYAAERLLGGTLTESFF